MSAPDPECSKCGGSGMVAADHNPPHPPTKKRCECVLYRDVIQNVERGLNGLSSYPKLGKESGFLDLVGDNLWVTGGETFLSHLRHVALRMPATWSFRVSSDAELVTAWLASIALKGGDILDADALKVSTRYITIPDLAVPPDLLIIRMGVKQARNQAACEVLAEALQIRMHEGKPTWVWDEPHHPLNSGHLFWSDAVARSLRPFKKVTVGKTSSAGTSKASPTAGSGRKKRKTLRGNS